MYNKKLALCSRLLLVARWQYDADAFIVAIKTGEAIAVKPPKKNRKRI
jgi:hypothetical protein